MLSEQSHWGDIRRNFRLRVASAEYRAWLARLRAPFYGTGFYRQSYTVRQRENTIELFPPCWRPNEDHTRAVMRFRLSQDGDNLHITGVCLGDRRN